jgi:hypothetical protein
MCLLHAMITRGDPDCHKSRPQNIHLYHVTNSARTNILFNKHQLKIYLKSFLNKMCGSLEVFFEGN